MEGTGAAASGPVRRPCAGAGGPASSPSASPEPSTGLAKWILAYRSSTLSVVICDHASMSTSARHTLRYTGWMIAQLSGQMALKATIAAPTTGEAASPRSTCTTSTSSASYPSSSLCASAPPPLAASFTAAIAAHRRTYALGSRAHFLDASTTSCLITGTRMLLSARRAMPRWSALPPSSSVLSALMPRSASFGLFSAVLLRKRYTRRFTSGDRAVTALTTAGKYGR